MPYDKHYRLPSREFSYLYTEAMYFGQQMEINLRAILYTADYHGWGNALVLSEEQRKRFKETELFIDKATCGAVIAAIRGICIISEPKLLSFFERACSHRNRLAHSFLSDQDFDQMTPAKETRVLAELQCMTDDLYKAARFTKALRTIAEAEADKSAQSLRDSLGELLGDDYCDPNRKYHTRVKKTRS